MAGITPLRPLRDDEQQILAFASLGYTPHDMARTFGVEDRIVRNGIARIRRTLGVRSLDEAVRINRTQEQP
jgi:DNA-binding NarL/FixJ family response regulator